MPGQVFNLILSFLCNRCLQVGQGGKSSQEYPATTGIPHSSILDHTSFLLYINELLICNIAVYPDDTTL